MKNESGQFSTLQLRGVGRSFGEAHALSNLNISIKSGEFIALLGPSGCGKSTALNCLAGLLPLTHGEIFIDEKRLDVLPPEKRDFGMVFQNYALFPHLTVAKNVAFGLEMRKIPKSVIKTKVKEALALVRLEDHIDKLPGQLSGGQQQRVAIARAVALEPQVVLMDEPLSNLDAKLRLDMRAEIRRLHDLLGLTTIYVTHDQEEALSMADRLIVLKDGLAQQIGTPEEVHKTPSNWYVADFMGYRNIVDVRVRAQQGTSAVAVGEGFEIHATLHDRVDGEETGVLAIRPEDFVISTDGSAQPASGVIRATVLLAEYQGHSYSILARSATGVRFYAQHDAALDVGTEISLQVKPERALVYSKTAPRVVGDQSHVEAKNHTSTVSVGN